MNLTMNEQGKIELNGELIEDWYTKRGIDPCEMRYIEIAENGKCKVCLLGAMGFSAVEARKTIDQFKADYDIEGRGFAEYISYLLGESKEDIHNLELGYLSTKADDEDVKKSPMQQLGYAAKLQLQSTIGISIR